MKPVIGVVTTGKGFSHAYMLNKYIKALEGCGAGVRILPWIQKKEDAKNKLSLCAALLLTGGDDIDPKFYNEAKRKSCGKVNERRDVAESLYFKEASARNLPILGVCRGAQMINVLCGGTLWQDIKEMPGSHMKHMNILKMKKTVHTVEISPGTLLFDICGCRAEINSVHHQALKDIAPSLVCSAVSTDGIPEAVEGKSGFLLGVQWHPEHLYGRNENSTKIFQAFTEAASAAQYNKITL